MLGKSSRKKDLKIRRHFRALLTPLDALTCFRVSPVFCDRATPEGIALLHY
jgi:hypothetical protein